ncbi:unnamed protein product [Miscanthus lutarioriparius]|uniref:Uncharacterized protein n=1 Tax=Miscanthus lutarioriparius TaxID=422564 RepID=A0A811Q5C4_9POAL|nr:unnamed protein product [Miscanthus lutarioriparius]
MDLVAGAVGSIVTKLGQLLHGEYKLQKGLPEQIEYLKNELESAHTALCKVGETPPQHLDRQVRLWAGDVREASYDMEDILDAFLVDVVEGAAPAETKNKKGLLKRLKKMAKLLKERKARHDIAGAIEDMKKRLQEVWDRRDRYSIPVAVAAPATKLDPRLVDMHKEAAQIIGIQRTRAELIAMLQSSTHGHGDAGASSSNNPTKIVSVVAAGGLGKTTLAKVVYDELSPGYDCRAFVSVGRNPDLVQVFISIFFGLDQNMYQAIRDVKDLQLLIGELRKFLENKSCGEENFITISNEDGGTSSRHKVRRIAHQNRILLDQSHPDSHRDMTQLRSLVALGCDIRGVVLHPSIKLLRVLALERCTPPNIQEYGRHWLEHLGKLVHLRYLGLRGTCVQELPEAIGALNLLQTLDLGGMRVRGHEVDVTRELRISVCMLLFDSLKQFLKELGNLSQLRVLSVSDIFMQDESLQAVLLKSLGNLQELQHLYLDCDDPDTGITPASTEWDKAVLSEHLRHLHIENIQFPCVPSFIDPTLLPNLCYLKLCVGHVDEAGLRALGGLPELRFLLFGAADYNWSSHKHATVVNIAAHDVFFHKLRSLKLCRWMVLLATNDDSTSASFSIWREEQDAAMLFDSKAEDRGRSRVAPAPVVVMPNLHALEFAVPVSLFYKDGHATRSDNFGLDLECLPSLRYVEAGLDSLDAFPDDMDKAEAELSRQAELHPNSSALTVDVYKV